MSGLITRLSTLSHLAGPGAISTYSRMFNGSWKQPTHIQSFSTFAIVLGASGELIY